MVRGLNTAWRSPAARAAVSRADIRRYGSEAVDDQLNLGLLAGDVPLRGEEPRAASAALDAKDTPHPLAAVTALIVDDEADARELVRFLLEARGAHVVTAASAGEALHLAGEQHFDVLIADIGMPEQDGYSLIRVLRNLPDPARQGLPAIAVTAYVSRRDREEALEAGYNSHLPKPIDPDQLIATVSSAVGGTQSRDRPTKAKRVRGTAARKRPSRDA